MKVKIFDDNVSLCFLLVYVKIFTFHDLALREKIT